MKSKIAIKKAVSIEFILFRTLKSSPFPECVLSLHLFNPASLSSDLSHDEDRRKMDNREAENKS